MINSILFITLTNGHRVSMKLMSDCEKELLEHLENCKLNGHAASFPDSSGAVHTAVRGDAISKVEVFKDGEPLPLGYPVSDKRGKPTDQDGVLSTVFHFLDGYQEIENPLSDYSAMATKIAAECPLMNKVSYQTSNGVVEIDMSKIIGYNLTNSWSCHCSTAKMMMKGCVSAKGGRCPSRKSLARVFGKP